MDWLNPMFSESLFEQVAVTAEATAPTNPSSLALAFVGVVTLLAFDWTRRLQAKHRKPSAPPRGEAVAEKKKAA